MSSAAPLTDVTPLARPTAEPSERDALALRFHVTSATLAGLVIGISLAVLAGWLLHLPGLTTAFSGVVTMKANLAVLLVLTGVSLWIYRTPRLLPRQLQVLRVCSGFTIAVSVLTLSQYLTGWDLHIDQLLVADPIVPMGMPGRMAVVSGLCLILLNSAIFLASGRWPRHTLAQMLVGLCVLMTALNTVGYFFAPPGTVEFRPFGNMAINTAAAMLLSSFAFFFARPSQGLMEGITDPGPGGMVIRQLLPVVCVLPLLLGWLSWQGVQAGVYQPEFAMALVVTLSIYALGYAVWAGGRVLRRFENNRVVAESERQHSEDRLRRAVEGAPVPMIIHNGDRVLHMSRGWTDGSGFTIADTPTLAGWISHAQPHEAERLPRYLKRLAEATDTIPGREQRVITKDGRERIWDFSTTPLGARDEPGRVFVAIAADVTARVEAERELRVMNEGLEQRIAERTTELTRANDALKRQSDQLKEQATLLDLVRDAILVRDLHGTIVYWSAGATDMYGWDTTVSLGQVSHQLLKAEYGRPLREIEAQVMKTGFWEGEVVQTTRAGARILVESRWTLTRTERGAPEGFLEVNRDITARKQAQNSLRDSELRFRAVAETAVDGIVSVDRGGTIQYWNPGAERLFGRTTAEVGGQPLAIALPDPSLNPYHQGEADPAQGTTMESTGRRRDGSTFPVEISVTAWHNTQGDRFFTCIIRDITARKQAEQELEAKAEELTRSNEELQQFAYVASHDLQEPLRMVSNYTQLLGRRYKDKLDDDANEFIGYAVDGAKRMQDLIHDLLAYARVGTRGKEFRRVPAAQIVADALSNLQNAVDESHADIQVGDLPVLLCDPTQMAQVFQNLIGNAVKFQRPGTRPQVRISAAHEPDGWLITIADNGIGIEAKYFERIFQMFQRLHGRTDYPGTGIGLALCKKIVERHGGRIRVESQPGAGTTFSFTLPQPAA